jgi:hypothetical protein
MANCRHRCYILCYLINSIKIEFSNRRVQQLKHGLSCFLLSRAPR